MRNPLLVLAVAAALTFLAIPHHATPAPSVEPEVATKAEANELIARQPGFFVPNLGQWDHPAKFVHRSGPMTLFLEDRGWVLDLVERPAEPKTSPHDPGHHAIPGDGEADRKIRGVGVRMTFEGDGHVPEIVGETNLPGHHNYFLGNDESRWRTDVPLYSSVRYEDLYPGIDLRLREANGVPEYDLLLQPGADLAVVNVHVEGAQGLSVRSDGSLVIETVLGPVTQSVPKTWQVGADGRKREVICKFTMLEADRFGFEAPGWDGDTNLTIDPGLIWSTFLGGSNNDGATALSVDASGVVTVAGWTWSTNFPTTSGAYDTTYNGGSRNMAGDVFVSRLDPRKTGTAQLVYSTFFGGGLWDQVNGLFVDSIGVVTVSGFTWSTDFPTTSGAYDTTHNGPFPLGSDVFVSRLDPSKTGSAQLVYSTFLGGDCYDYGHALSVDSIGVATVAGYTCSASYPTTSGAYDTTHNGQSDAFISRLRLLPLGRLSLVYSTFLGGSNFDYGDTVATDVAGVITVAGNTLIVFAPTNDFPTTRGAYDTTYNGGTRGDVYVSRLDPSKTGSAQLVYSTYLGGTDWDQVKALSVDSIGVVTVAGFTSSNNYPTTSGAYDTTYNGDIFDTFVSRLDPSKTGSVQLVYSTFLGGNGRDGADALSVDSIGVVTVTGWTNSTNYPTTSGTYDTTFNGAAPNYPPDAFVTRLDPSKSGTAQLVYSTYLGGSRYVAASALAVDASGVAIVAGRTNSANFPTTSGAYDTTYNGGGGYMAGDVFISRLDMGVAMYGDVHDILITTGGSQKLTVNAGKPHANRLYWIFGSITGTSPGVNLLGVHIPLNPDLYTDVAMGAVNTTVFTKFKGTLDANGLATASFNVPANLPLPSGFTFHHAYVVYDASGKFYLASNAVPLRLRK